MYHTVHTLVGGNLCELGHLVGLHVIFVHIWRVVMINSRESIKSNHDEHI